MKYVLEKDLRHAFNKYKFYIIFFFIMTFSYLLLQKLLQTPYDIQTLTEALGMDLDVTHFPPFLYFLFHTVFFVYITVGTFAKDFRNGEENLFLRINIRKWGFMKVVSLFVISIMIETICFMLLYLFFYLGSPIVTILKIFLIDLLTIGTIVITSCLITLHKINILLLLPLIYISKKAEWYSINLNPYLIASFIIIAIIYFLLLIKRRKNKLFEKIN